MSCSQQLTSHRENKKAKLRTQLTELAIETMLTQGYDSVSLEKLAEKTNVSVRNNSNKRLINNLMPNQNFSPLDIQD